MSETASVCDACGEAFDLAHLFETEEGWMCGGCKVVHAAQAYAIEQAGRPPWPRLPRDLRTFRWGWFRLTGSLATALNLAQYGVRWVNRWRQG